MSFQNVDSAGFEVVKLIGGAGLSALFITVLILAIFTQGLSSLASTSRLLYVMGRDSELPKRIFGSLHPKFKTPVINIIIVSLFSLLALVISLETAVKFVSFGALTAFIFVNLSVIAQRFFKQKQRSFKQTLLYLVFPLTGAGFIAWLLSLLDKTALLSGLIWILFGMAYHVYQKFSIRLAASKKAGNIHPGTPIDMNRMNNIES
jgi:putrescine importer